MSLQMIMNIDGVTGESKSFAHKGWFDVESWNWGLTSGRKSSSDMQNDKTNMNEISVIKWIGIDSAGTRSLYAAGTVIPFVDFTIMPVVAKRTAQKRYLELHMEDVVIKSIITSGNNEDKMFKEHLTLIYDRIHFAYSQDELVRGEEVAPSDDDFRWNISGNKKW